MSKNSVILERRYVPKGTVVAKQGEPGTSAYIIQSGSVEVFTQYEGQKIQLAKLETGQIFGEMALIFDSERTASVQTLEDCNLIIITRQAFEEKLKKSDSTIRAIVEMLTSRIVSSNNAVVKQKTDIDDLLETSRIIYQNVLSSLPRSRQKDFQESVLPHLDAFLESVKSFRSKL